MNTPLSVLINRYISKNNLSRNKLAQSLGYKNISKGLRNLNKYCLTLKDTNNISKKLSEILNIPEFENAVYDVQSKIELKARSQFKPLVQVILSRRPSPLFVASFCPQLWHVEIPDIKNCNFEQELQKIFKAYQKQQLKVNHRRKYKHFIENIEQKDKDSRPYSWTVGNGYRYFRTYATTLEFNRYGEIVDQIKSHIDPNKATLSVGGKPIPPSIIGE